MTPEGREAELEVEEEAAAAEEEEVDAALSVVVVEEEVEAAEGSLEAGGDESDMVYRQRARNEAPEAKEVQRQKVPDAADASFGWRSSAAGCCDRVNEAEECTGPRVMWVYSDCVTVRTCEKRYEPTSVVASPRLGVDGGRDNLHTIELQSETDVS